MECSKPSSQLLVVEYRFPSLNETVAAAKKHWSVYSKEKELMTQLVCVAAMRQGIQSVERAKIGFTWYEKDRRRDPDNISGAGKKPILDGLVRAGVLPNDGWSVIEGLSDLFSVDRSYPRVEVTILS
jgi:hypothetical protein